MTHYFLKTVNADMTTYGGFIWPVWGHVRAPDWNPNKSCGGGLHGFLNGHGDYTLSRWEPDVKWLVFAADEYIDLGGEVKTPHATVVYVGSNQGAADFLHGVGVVGPVMGATYLAGDDGTAMAGDDGTAMAGHHGTAMAGDGGIILIEYYRGGLKRIATGYIGEDGLEPNVPYKVDGTGVFYAVEPTDK